MSSILSYFIQRQCTISFIHPSIHPSMEGLTKLSVFTSIFLRFCPIKFFFGNIANKIPQFIRKLESTLKNSFLRHSVRPYFSQTFAYFIYNMYFYVVFRCDFISRTIKTYPFPNTVPDNLCHYRHSCSMVKHCLV